MRSVSCRAFATELLPVAACEIVRDRPEDGVREARLEEPQVHRYDQVLADLVERLCHERPEVVGEPAGVSRQRGERGLRGVVVLGEATKEALAVGSVDCGLREERVRIDAVVFAVVGVLKVALPAPPATGTPIKGETKVTRSPCRAVAVGVDTGRSRSRAGPVGGARRGRSGDGERPAGRDSRSTSPR
jgi:hypothetical protein